MKNEHFKRAMLSSYYSTSKFPVENIESREFGVGFDRKIEVRHLSFPSEDSLRAYLSERTPSYVSFSSAIYERPELRPMERKGWIGSDLVFDLDSDEKDPLKVYSSLSSILEQAVRLKEDFLMADFGFSENEIHLFFSGNRGYHVHVRSDDSLPLGQKERREMVNYIKGIGLDISLFFSKRDDGRIIGPSESDGGYRKKVFLKIKSILLSNPGAFYRGRFNPRHFLEGISSGNWSRIPISFGDLKKRISRLCSDIPLSSVDIDAAVTYDLHKLIRLPNSVHGGSGLVASEVKDPSLFNPLEHSVLSSNGVAVAACKKDFSVEISGKTIELKKGEKKELEAGICLFLLCKGLADIEDFTLS